jgi:hypothetical protein
MNFFRFLGHKVESDPRPSVERDLLRKLDDAFNQDFGTAPARNPFRWFTELEIFRFVPLAAAMALILVLGNQIERSSPRTEAPAAFAFAPDSIESSWLDGKGDRLEFYDEMEDWMLTASDEDWDAILEKDG